MSTLYRIYCLDPSDKGWQTIWDDEPPTECPTDPAHAVNLNSVQLLETSNEVLRVSVNRSTNRTVSTRFSHFQYNPTANGIARRAAAIVYKSGDMTSFEIVISDATNRNDLLTVNLDNTVEEDIVNLGELSNMPAGNAMLEVTVRRVGGSSTSVVYMDELVFYT